MSMDSDYAPESTQTQTTTQTLTETEGRPYKQMPALTGDENALLAQAALVRLLRPSSLRG